MDFRRPSQAGSMDRNRSYSGSNGTSVTKTKFAGFPVKIPLGAIRSGSRPPVTGKNGLARGMLRPSPRAFASLPISCAILAPIRIYLRRPPLTLRSVDPSQSAIRILLPSRRLPRCQWVRGARPGLPCELEAPAAPVVVRVPNSWPVMHKPPVAFRI